MGFLKFLKRQKKEDHFGDLDLPPMPPPIDDLGADSMPMPPMEGMKFDAQPKAQAKDDDFKLDFDDKMLDQGLGLPEMDDKFPELPKDDSFNFDIPDLDEKSAQMQAPEFPEPPANQLPVPATKPEGQPAQKMPEKPQRKIVHTQLVKSGNVTYLRVDKFKAALGLINVIRADLKKSDEALGKLEHLKTGTDRSFDRLKGSMHDLQKKLIFVDKTLFKGD